MRWSEEQIEKYEQEHFAVKKPQKKPDLKLVKTEPDPQTMSDKDNVTTVENHQETIQEPSPMQPNTNPKPPSQPKARTTAIVIVIVLVVVLTSVLIYYKNKK